MLRLYVRNKKNKNNKNNTNKNKNKKKKKKDDMMEKEEERRRRGEQLRWSNMALNFPGMVCLRTYRRNMYLRQQALLKEQFLSTWQRSKNDMRKLRAGGKLSPKWFPQRVFGGSGEERTRQTRNEGSREQTK